MTEWGRNSATAGRPPARLPWVALGILLGMALSAGGLYAAWPGIDVSDKRDRTALETEAAALRDRVAELENQLARGQSQTNSGKSPDASARVAALEKRAQEQAARIKDLSGRLEIAEKLNGDLQATLEKSLDDKPAGEVAALRAQIAERDDLLRKFDAELAEAERKAAKLAAERDALLAKPAGDGGTKISELETKLAQANRQEEALRKTVAERDKALAEMDGEIARLEKIEAEAQELRKAIAARPSSDPAADKAARLTAETRLAAAESELAKLQPRLQQAENSAASSAAALEEAKRSAGNSAAENRKLLDGANAQIAALNDKIASLGAEIATLKSQVAAKAQEKPAAKGAADATAAAREPRDPLAVAEAMARTKGLENLDERQRDRIGEGLIEGECVAKVLTDVFGRPPAVAVRDLVKALDSDC